MTSVEPRPAEAEAHLEAVINSTIDAIVTVTVDGTIVLFNRGAADMFGVSADDALGTNMDRFIPGRLQASYRRDLRKVARARVDRLRPPTDFTARRADGTEFPVEATLSAVTLGDMRCIVAVLRDVTRRRAGLDRLERANEEVARRASELQALFDVLPVGVAIAHDAGVRDVSINPEFARLLGISVGVNASKSGPDASQLPFRLLQDGRELAPANLPLERAIRGERVDGVVIEVRRDDGEVREMLEFATPVVDRLGTVQGAVGAVVDITERRRAERALQDARDLIDRTMESVTNGIATLDRDLNFQYLNPRAEQITGYASEELVGRPATVVLASSPSGLSLGPMIEQMRADRIPRSGFELAIRAKDGSEVDVSFGLAPLVSGDEVTGFVIAAEDIRERKRALQELRTAKEFNDRLMASVTNGIAVLDADLRFQSINAQGLEIAGHATPRGLIGRYVGDVLRSEDRPKVSGMFERVRRTLEPVRGLETQLTRPDGDRRWLSLGVAPLLDTGGAVGGFVCAAEDITARRAAEQAMLQAQKLESLGVLAGGIAHDFNNLLVGILGNAGLALMEMAPEAPGRDTVRAIELAGQRASELVRQMLAYSGRGRFTIERIDLNAIIDEMSHLTRASIPRTVTIEHRFAATLPAVVVDATQVRQLVMNLVVNASDAMEDSGGVVVIETGLVDADREYLAGSLLSEELAEGPYAFLEVSDTGCGMDDATRERIFDPFFSTKFAGRGLGLAAVLGIVRGHGGAIRVASEPGRGTSIRVLFPAAGEAPVAAARPPLEFDDVATGTVLVVDDEPSVRHVTSRALERMGFSVLLAADGEAAVAVFRERGPDLACVLLDLTMPRVGGEEAYEAMRSLDPAIPVVIMSGYSEQDAMERFADRPPAAFIQKPYDVRSLRETVLRVARPHC